MHLLLRDLQYVHLRPRQMKCLKITGSFGSNLRISGTFTLVIRHTTLLTARCQSLAYGWRRLHFLVSDPSCELNNGTSVTMIVMMASLPSTNMDVIERKEALITFDLGKSLRATEHSR